MHEAKPILIAENLFKNYYMNSTTVKVLKGIDLEIYKGEIIAITGPSGVGKSTLLHILGILDRPTKGRVLLGREDVFKYNDKKLAEYRNQKVGFVFQFHHLLPEFTALENVMIPGMIAGIDKDALSKRAVELLSEVGLAARISHKPNELSGGEQQRVAVARALINFPQLLLADEPSGNLDAESARSLHELLWKLNKEKNQTMVIVTHNLELASRADRIIELYDGRIKRIIKKPQSRENGMIV